jgi:hypothetical protein
MDAYREAFAENSARALHKAQVQEVHRNAECACSTAMPYTGHPLMAALRQDCNAARAC